MIRNLQKLALWQRRLVFFLVFGGILMAMIAFTWLLARQSFSGGRILAGALVPDVSVREFVQLPGDDAYPAAVAVGANGMIYTGSYKNGALWVISPDGLTVTEVPNTREEIGAVAGIAIAADGAVLVVDQLDADPRNEGGRVVRVFEDRVERFADIDDERGFISPNDIEIDSAGNVYVSDPGRNEIWRFTPDGTGGSVWWVPPVPDAPADGSTPPRRGLTGLAYDVTRNALIITDPELNEIFRVSLADNTTERLYHHEGVERPPGFDGATVSADGTLYVATLGTNGVAVIRDGTLEYLAGIFRGASDVAFAAPNRLYVTNFDQASLAPIVLTLFAPQLPFALDVIELGVPANE